MQDVETRLRQRDLQDLTRTIDDASRQPYDGGMKLSSISLVLAASLSLLFPAVSQAAERRYSISDFDQIQVIGPHKVIVQTGRATSVMAVGDTEALDALSIEALGGVLKILSLVKARSRWKEGPHPAARVIVVLPQLKAIRLLGSGTIAAAELRGISTTITLNGSGQISVAKLASDGTTARLSGSGRIALAGTVKNFDANISGSGDLDAAQLTASDLKIVSASSGRVTAKSVRTADVKQNGAGMVKVTGGPSCLVENPGSGSASCGD